MLTRVITEVCNPSPRWCTERDRSRLIVRTCAGLVSAGGFASSFDLFCDVTRIVQGDRPYEIRDTVVVRGVGLRDPVCRLGH